MTIHYHGTPITPRAELLGMAGAHFCVSFARPDDLATVLRIGQSAMFDNGAYSTYRLGQKYEPMKFYEWLEPMLAAPHWAVIPDVIDGTVQEQLDLARTWPFWQQLGAPVWHLAEPIEHLMRVADSSPRICFGSSGAFWKIGSPAWCQRMDEAFNALYMRRRYPPWVHGLRMIGQVAGPWPLASVDSTNVAQNFKPGCANCKSRELDAWQAPSLWTPRATQIGML